MRFPALVEHRQDNEDEKSQIETVATNMNNLCLKNYYKLYYLLF